MFRWLPEKEPIDLLNVAFQQPHQKECSYDVPDRLSGRDAWQELSECCPTRSYRFVEINVPLDVRPPSAHWLGANFQESRAHRQNVLDLIYPSDTGKSELRL